MPSFHDRCLRPVFEGTDRQVEKRVDVKVKDDTYSLLHYA